MARHRSLIAATRRRIARWPIAVVSLVVLVLVAWLGWTWLDGFLDRRAAAQAAGCGQGEQVVNVAVAPSAKQPLDEAARRWNEQHQVVFDHCIRVTITAIDSNDMLTGLTAARTYETVSDRAQAWLPESTLWINRLAATDNSLLGSAPTSVASSPIVLALPEDASTALSMTQGIKWADLAAISSAPNGWANLGKPDWGKFTLALPDPATNPASGLALQGALAGASEKPTGPVTTATLSAPVVQTSITQLSGSQPEGLPKTTQGALTKLGESESVRGAPYSAVAVSEVDLYRRNTGLDGTAAAKHPLFEVGAVGPSPAADYPFVALAGTRVNEVQVRAAQAFRVFLSEPAQQTEFTRAGLRANGQTDYPRKAPGLRWDSVSSELVPADAGTTQQISATWADVAGGGQVVTTLVDVSKSMTADGGKGKSRMDWVKESLHQLTDYSVAGSVGLWEFSRNLDGTKPYKQLVPTKAVTAQRTGLHAGIDKLVPVSATQMYSSLEAVYKSAKANHVAAKRNRIIVITDGPNDGGMDYQELRNSLKSLTDRGKPISISFITIGDNTDIEQLRDLARDTQGSVFTLTTAEGVSAALGQTLSVGG